MAFLGIGIDTINEKVEHGLIYDASKQKLKDDKKKSAEKWKKAENNAIWKVIKATWKKEREGYITEIADMKFTNWQAWIKTNRSLKQSKADPEAIASAKKANDDQLDSEINEVLNDVKIFASYYIADAKTYKPDVAKNISEASEVTYVLTKAEESFKKKVEAFMKLANAAAKAMALQQLGSFDADKISMKLSEIPLKIEEKIDSLKETLDKLLGKIAGKMFQPESPDFDINALLKILKSFLDPVLATTKPLTAVVGNIPIIGDIMPLLSGASGGGSMSKEDLKKFIAQYKKPTLPPDLMEKINKVYDDIMVFCISLPTILSNLIFEMLNVVYSKLKIITSVIPLGGMFPLSLVDAAITAGPKILQLVKVMPGLVFDCVKGILIDKWTEAMALGNLKPNIDAASLQALSEDIAEQKISKKTKTKNKEDYNDISKKIYEKYKLNEVGYSLAHIKKIQKNYKEIFNGSKEELVTFVDNGNEQNLPAQTANSLANFGASIGNGIVNLGAESTNLVTTWGTGGFAGTELDSQSDKIEKVENDETDLEYGFDKKKTKREKPSVVAYEKYLEGVMKKYFDDIKYCTSGNEGDIKLKYLKLYKTEGVVGGLYDLYKDQLKQYGTEVIIEEELKPNPGFFGMGKNLKFELFSTDSSTKPLTDNDVANMKAEADAAPQGADAYQ